MLCKLSVYKYMRVQVEVGGKKRGEGRRRTTSEILAMWCLLVLDLFFLSSSFLRQKKCKETGGGMPWSEEEYKDIEVIITI